jgi:non-specific serine/threonine protein kinase/serine/threonine-protein kinase
MLRDRWDEIKEKLLVALELEPAQRSAYLAQIGAADPDLRKELDSLIASHERTGTGFLGRSLAELSSVPATRGDRSPLPGQRLGSYEIVEQIGVGGMGEVYRAFRADDEYQKQVAIKLIRAGQSSDFVINRFKNERQILAGLDHPYIARLLDGGRTEEGVPYFVMELIQGQPLDDYCDEHKLPITDRLKLFLQVCSAVQYAHQRLIIHRDIKPSNILVAAGGVPKLLDFGIAKILDEGAAPEPYEPTLTVFRILTPGYASPEQIRGEPITTASDVYSLGVVLYELLAGRSPYRVSDRAPHELSRAACEDEPEKLSSAVRRKQPQSNGSLSINPAEIAAARGLSPEKLSRRLAGDLDTIVLAALRKEPERRYGSVEQFAQDICRHIDNLPILAQRGAVAYRASKFIKRHWIGVVATAAVTVALLAGLAVAFRESHIARQQAEIASRQRARAERRFNDVRSLANSLLFDIHDSIQDLPGATAARKVLVDRAVQYLDSLAQEAAGDPGLQRELASAYERLGDLQDKPQGASSSLGDEVAAMQSYNKSLNLRETVARTNQANAEDAVSLARIHRLIANAAADSGDVSGAVEHAKKALAVATAVSEVRLGNNTAAESELAWDYMALGNIESRGGFNSIGLSEPYAAIRDSEKALAIASELLKNDPDNPSLAYEVAGLYERIGGLQAMNGHRLEGLRKLNLALNMFRSAGTRSGDASLPSTVADVSSIIGIVFEMDGRLQSALAYYEQELATFKNRAKRDPQDMMARSDLSGAYYDVGDTLVKMGRLKDGLASIRSAIALDKELVSVDPKRGALRSLLAQHRVAEAEALNKVGDAAGALQSYKEARSLYQSLAELDDLNLDARLNVSATDAKIAATYVRLGRFDEALETYWRALRVSEPPAGRNPPNLQAQYTLADSYSGMGDVAVHLAGRSRHPMEQLSYWKEAGSWYEKSLGIWHMIPNRSVISPSEFDVGDPEQVAKQLAACKATLEKLEKSAVAPNENE